MESDISKVHSDELKNIFFPYEPYECQKNFMESIFLTLSNKKAGIFESPTGTGKSLSLLCGVLKFLAGKKLPPQNKLLSSSELKNEKKIKNENSTLEKEPNNPPQSNHDKINCTDLKKEDDWLSNFGSVPKEVTCVNKQPVELCKNFNKENVSKKRKFYDINGMNNKSNSQAKRSIQETSPNLDEDKKMLINENLLLNDNKNIQKSEYKSSYNYNSIKEPAKLQVFYCTRTHSQISQVISEVKKIKTKYLENSKDNQSFDFSFTSLGSRKLLCTNTNVNTNSSNFNQINEKCLELIQTSEGSSKCHFYNQESIESFSNEINKKVFDIEDLHKLGLDINTCPYFSSRKAMDNSDIIILPYNSIINSKIRKSLNIELENKIIIFDEAHNLVENILQTFNGEINFDNLMVILLGMNLYYEKYSNKLKSSSNMFLRQLIKIVESFLKFITDLKFNKEKNKVHNLSEILIDLDIHNMNIFNLLNFIEITELHNKIKWTLEKFLKENLQLIFTNNKKKSTTTEENNLQNSEPIPDLLTIFKKFNLNISKSSSSKFDENFIDKFNFENLKKYFYLNSTDMFSNLINILNGLTYINDDGKIIFEEFQSLFCTDPKMFGKIKFIMVNPCREFDYIIKNSKCVIFAGGTMRPLEEFNLLLKVLDKSQIEYFEGSHVVDKSNIFFSNLTCDLKKFEKLIFNHENFSKNESFMLEQILSIINFQVEEISKQVWTSKEHQGKGIVIFLHTYSIIEKIKNLNEKNKILNFEKQNIDLLFEDKFSEHIFSKYTDNIKNKKKLTILFSVIGGKLSEGINFSDDLARIVIVFGLPYPNITSSELKIKMNYYDTLYNSKESSINGNEYYENICMKAVNQSIGRSIRHSMDYAAILLVDFRYSNERVKTKLPKWILNADNCGQIVDNEKSLKNI
jgi:chromosome transmission fidelity protein 1